MNPLLESKREKKIGLIIKFKKSKNNQLLLVYDASNGLEEMK